MISMAAVTGGSVLVEEEEVKQALEQDMERAMEESGRPIRSALTRATRRAWERIGGIVQRRPNAPAASVGEVGAVVEIGEETRSWAGGWRGTPAGAPSTHRVSCFSTANVSRIGTASGNLRSRGPKRRGHDERAWAVLGKP